MKWQRLLIVATLTYLLYIFVSSEDIIYSNETTTQFQDTDPTVAENWRRIPLVKISPREKNKVRAETHRRQQRDVDKSVDPEEEIAADTYYDEPKSVNPFVDSIVRPEYGVAFVSQGSLYQNLQRQYLFMTVDIPHENDLRHTFSEFPDCERWKKAVMAEGESWPQFANWVDHIKYSEDGLLYEFCLEARTMYNDITKSIKMYAQDLILKTRNTLPHMLPTRLHHDMYGRYIKINENEKWYSKKDTQDKAKWKEAAMIEPRRKKRIAPALIFSAVSTVGGMIAKGVSIYREYKDRQAMLAAIKALHANQVATTDTLNKLSNSTLYLARTVDTEMNNIKERLDEHDDELDRFDAKITELVNYIDDTLAGSIRHLHMQQAASLMILSRLLRTIFQDIVGYRTLLIRYDMVFTNFLHSLDGLSTGRLDSNIMDPLTLNKYLRTVKHDLRMAENNEWELAIGRTYQYYATALTTYTNTPDQLLLQIPLFLKQKATRRFELFSVKTVPVPADEETYKGQASRYTRIMATEKFEYIAANRKQFLPISETELRQCPWLLGSYFCETSHLLRGESEKSCIAALFYNHDPTEIVTNCPTKYEIDTPPNPLVIDAGHTLLVSQMPPPWNIVCGNSNQALPISQTMYTVIKRTELCECSLSTGSYYIGRATGYCKEKEGTDGIFSMNYVHNKILFETLRVQFDQVFPEGYAEETTKLQKYIPQTEIPLLSQMIPHTNGTRRKILRQEGTEIRRNLGDVIQLMMTNQNDQFFATSVDYLLWKDSAIGKLSDMNSFDLWAFVADIISYVAFAVAILTLLCYKRIMTFCIASSPELPNVTVVKQEKSPTKRPRMPTAPELVFGAAALAEMLPTSSAKAIKYTAPPPLTLLPLNLDDEEEEIIDEEQKLVQTCNALMIVLYTVVSLAMAFTFFWQFWKRWRHRSSVLRTCFPLYPVGKWLTKTGTIDLFLQIIDQEVGEVLWAHFKTVAALPDQIRIVGVLRHNDIQVMSTCGFKFLNVDWKQVMIYDSENHVIHMPSRGSVSVFTPTGIEHIDSDTPYKITLMGRMLDHYFEIKTDNDSILNPMYRQQVQERELLPSQSGEFSFG